jgi:arginine repressor
MPEITNRGESTPTAPTRSEVDTFLADLKKKAPSARGRLIFALDATASREATQEGDDREVKQVFQAIADVTKGAYCRFDPGAAHQLAELLRAVAVYAAGGMTALAARRDAGAVKLLGQMK